MLSLRENDLAWVHSKDLTNNTATEVFKVALPTLGMVAGVILYTIICTDGVDMQAHSGYAEYSAVNKGGVYTSNISQITSAAGGESEAKSAGTLTDTWSITTGTNEISIKINANSSLTPTTLRIYFRLIANPDQKITLS